ncbi:MAG: M23 family metallopeptidase [Pseudomonadota bacterium]
MATLIPTIVMIVLPLVFGIAFATGAYRAWFGVRGPVSDALIGLSLTAILGFLLVAGPWAFGIFWLRYVTAGLVAVGLIRFLATFWRTPTGPGGIFNRIGQVFTVVLGLLFGAALALSVQGFRPPNDEPVVDLSFPLKGGLFVVGHGGASEALNYHVVSPTQRYAVDVIAINAAGLRANRFPPRTNEDYAIWGAQVVAPCAGTVAFARDGLPDADGAQSDRETPAGNMIALNCDDVTVLIAHLQNGSVAVETGDAVDVGDDLGLIGNSGNTTEPHLHIHVERGPYAGEFSDNIGAPARFDGRFLLRNDLVRR